MSQRNFNQVKVISLTLLETLHAGAVKCDANAVHLLGRLVNNLSLVGLGGGHVLCWCEGWIVLMLADTL